MTSHLSDQQLMNYLNGEYETLAEYEICEAHLSRCEECKNRLLSANTSGQTGNGEKPMTGTTRTRLEEDAHPGENLLAKYARQPSAVPTPVVAHIAVCRRCSEDVEAMRTYQSLLTPNIWAEALTAATTGVLSAPPLERLRAMAKGLFTRRPALVAAPFCLALALFLLSWWRTRPVVEIVDDAGRWTLTRDGEVRGPLPLTPELRTMVQTALETRKLALPTEISSLRNTDANGYHPTGTYVLSDSPTLSWQPVNGVVSYLCTVTAPDVPTFKRTSAKPLLKPSWTPKKPLPRGVVYTWHVTTIGRDGRKTLLKGSPLFKILEKDRAQKVEGELRDCQNSSLLRGVLAASVGLLDDANGEFTHLRNIDPHSEIVQEFYRQSLGG